MVTITRRKVLAGGAAVLAGAGLSQVVGAGAEVTPGRSRARRIATDRTPPASADVVVIGGGNIGAAAAFYLAKQGLSVALCEKGAIAGEASGRSVGHAAALGSEPELHDLALLARQRWPGVNAELQEETGYRRTGMVMQIRDEASRDYWRDWIGKSGEVGAHAAILSPAEAAKLVQPTAPWFGAIYDPIDGRAEPTLIAPAFASAARRSGVRIVAPCAVRGLETAGGKLIGVVTEAGVIKTRRALYAGGAWSSTFMRHLGLHLPTANLFSWCASFAGVSGPNGGAIFNGVTARRQIDGGFTGSIMELTMPITPDSFRFAPELYAAWKGGNWPVSPRLGWYSMKELATDWGWSDDQTSPFERRRILEPTVNEGVVDKTLAQLRESIPAFKAMRRTDAWGGVISMATDQKPVLGPVPGIDGLTIATSVSSGVLLGPTVGAIMADLIGGRQPEADLRPFAVDRFRA